MTTLAFLELAEKLHDCRDFDEEPVSWHGASSKDLDELNRALGKEMPSDLREWLSIVDGLELTTVGFSGAREIVDDWNRIEAYRKNKFVPIAGDGCGNHYVLVLEKFQASSPVVFIEGILGRDVVNNIVASSLRTFIYYSIIRSIETSDECRWPFKKDFVMQHDPDIVKFGYPLPWER